MSHAITERIEALTKSFGSPRKPVDQRGYRYLFSRNEYTKIVQMVKTEIKLDCRMVVGYVNKGGDAKHMAWVELPQLMPTYGTQAFKRHVFRVFVRKDLVHGSTCDAYVMSIAHELCHIVLSSIGHSLAGDEKTVDLAAMYLGYHEFFPEGSKMMSQSWMVRRRALRWKGWLRWRFEDTYERQQGKSLGRLGYLSDDEIRFAMRAIKARL